jgi:23S rRNA pseudouridine1911/1915/1917 synthase
LVQGDKTGDEPLDSKVKTYIRKKYNKEGNVFLGIPHRLDRPVSGVVMFARTSKALQRLNKMFHDNLVKKTYWALIKDLPPQNSGNLIHFMKKNQKQNKSYCYDDEVKESKKAELSYSIKGRSNSFYLLEINLKTGRHHQIRSQLAQIGCPIKGDLKYGYPRSNNYGGIALHARKIEFIHPVSNKNILIEADLPKVEPIWFEINS